MVIQVEFDAPQAEKIALCGCLLVIFNDRDISKNLYFPGFGWRVTSSNNPGMTIKCKRPEWRQREIGMFYKGSWRGFVRINSFLVSYYILPLFDHPDVFASGSCRLLMHGDLIPVRSFWARFVSTLFSTLKDVNKFPTITTTKE